MDDGSNWTNEQVCVFHVANNTTALGEILVVSLQFHAAIAAGEQAYLDALHSYTEQRDIAAVLGLGYLGTHPLAANITERISGGFAMLVVLDIQRYGEPCHMLYRSPCPCVAKSHGL